ncbi:MAG: ATP-binding protein [Pseudomonadota bacterium]
METVVSFELKVPGDSEAIVAAEAKLQAHLEEAGVPGMVISRAVLTLEEVVLNACRHGGAAEVSVNLEVEDRGCRLIFEDAGTPFDPLSGQFLDGAPVRPDPEDGGRGLLLIRRSATRSHYEHVHGRNRLVLEFQD